VGEGAKRVTTGMDGRVLEGRRQERQTGQRISHASPWPKLIEAYADKFVKDLSASFGAASLIHWIPVAFGLGILVYFAAAAEQGAPFIYGCLAFAGILAASAWLFSSGRYPDWFRLASVIAALAFAALGFGVSALRTQSVSAPKITAPVGPLAVEGWVERDDAGPRMRRVVLRVTWLEGFKKADAPERIQIATPCRAGVTPGRRHPRL
jgi:competence protein ComEC